MKTIKIGKATLIHGDCEEFMRGMPDKCFDLAVVDPPYREHNEPDQWMRETGGKMKDFGKIPDKFYFNQLSRVSGDFICWGGNYFTDNLTANNNWIVWYKMNDGVHFSMAEMAYSSIRKNVKVFHYMHNGAKGKIHPTQKPVKLYEWILKNYAKPGQTILDTHGGSMSSVIAALNMGFEITCIEKDEDYFNAAVERVIKSQQQQKLF